MLKHLTTIATLLMLVLVAIPVTVLAEDGQNNDTGQVEDRATYITTARGTTGDFGGGDYFYIQFGKEGSHVKDASFGIIYGTEDNPNSIVIVAKHLRFIGMANVREENANNGESTAVPLVVQTVVAQKLQDLFEFNDTNNDSICNYRKSGDGLRYDDYPQHEPIYKRVSLATAWTPEVSTEKEITEDGVKKKTWTVTLTAENLSYRGIKVDPDSADKLEMLQFTFHLTASLVQVDNATVPQYDVTVRKGNLATTVTDSDRVDDRVYSGKVGDYTIKYDHLIRGWDFHERNENPFLLLEFHMIVGNYIPPYVAKWMRSEFLREHSREGGAQYETVNGTTEEITEENSVDEDKPVDGLPKRIKGKRIHLGDQWESVGRLTWVSNVTVDGVEKEMYAQIQGGKRINFHGWFGGAFRGFAVLGGFSYPGGESIYHDPEISSSMFLASSVEDTDTSTGFTGRGVVVVVGIVAVGVVAAVALGHRRRQPPVNPYERALDMPSPAEKKGSNGKPDWDELLK